MIVMVTATATATATATVAVTVTVTVTMMTTMRTIEPTTTARLAHHYRRPAHARDQAAIAALPLLKAAFAPESSTTFYRAKLAIWPLPAPLPPAATLLATTDSAAAEGPGAGVGAPVYSRPSFTIALRYKSSKYARQGEAVFRNTILAFVREMPGFVECW